MQDIVCVTHPGQDVIERLRQGAFDGKIPLEWVQR
jgi:hypothetical protein